MNKFFRKHCVLTSDGKSKTSLLANRSTTPDNWLSAGIGHGGFGLNATLTEDRARIECFIRVGKGGDERSKAVFRMLLERKAEIEGSFGAALDWQELPTRYGCRICKCLDGGWKAPESEWPALQDRMLDHMIRLEAALKGPIQALKS